MGDLEFRSPDRLDGSEAIMHPALGEVARIRDFWAWAYSDLLSNTDRGTFAEFLVAKALGCADGVRAAWDVVDCRSREGVPVEVKSGAYVQRWFQRKLSRVVLDIRPTRAWDPMTNVMQEERERRAKAYVFCVLAWKDKTSINPLDLRQWEFYVLETAALERMSPNRKTISLDRVKKLGATKVGFEGIADAVAECVGKGRDTSA